MPEINKKEFKRDPGSCVIHDDDHGWGGPEPEGKEILKEKIKKIIVVDEPKDWPFLR